MPSMSHLSEQMQMLQTFLAVVSIFVGILTIATAIVLVTKFVVKGGAEAKAQIDRLATALDRLTNAVEHGFDKVHEELDVVKIDHNKLEGRVVRVETLLNVKKDAAA